MGRYDEESLEESSTSSSRYTEDSESGGGRAKNVGSGGEPLRPIAGNTPMEVLAGGIAGASVASAAAAMVLAPYNLVFAAGGLSWCV